MVVVRVVVEVVQWLLWGLLWKLSGGCCGEDCLVAVV